MIPFTVWKPWATPKCKISLDPPTIEFGRRIDLRAMNGKVIAYASFVTKLKSPHPTSSTNAASQGEFR
jgi:hypothetical protein